MEVKSTIAAEVEEVYEWLNRQIENKVPHAQRCIGCGKCCDFESYGHRLFITTPEMIHFRIKIGKDNLKAMHDGVCPYVEDGKCSIHPYRFAGCRIFFCKGDEDFQSYLSEESIRRFKHICNKYDLPYQYKDLASTLNFLAKD